MSQKDPHPKHKRQRKKKQGSDDEDDVNRYCQFHIGDEEEEDEEEDEDDELPPLSSSTVSGERNDRESSAESALEMLEATSSICRCALFYCPRKGLFCIALLFTCGSNSFH